MRRCDGDEGWRRKKHVAHVLYSGRDRGEEVQWWPGSSGLYIGDSGSTEEGYQPVVYGVNFIDDAEGAMRGLNGVLWRGRVNA
jgi:hypothetical protein